MLPKIQILIHLPLITKTIVNYFIPGQNGEAVKRASANITDIIHNKFKDFFRNRLL